MAGAIDESELELVIGKMGQMVRQGPNLKDAKRGFESEHSACKDHCRLDSH